MSADLNAAIFQDADKARERLEAIRWPNGAVCPHCGNCDPDAIKALQGKAHRKGVYQCAECRQQFTVTVGTVFERSKIPLNKWLLATYLLSSSKKGMSSHQLHRMLGVTYKTAWFMTHRIREAMATKGGVMGGPGGVVEADETYFGDTDAMAVKKRKAGGNIKGERQKRAVVSLVERGGNVRSFHVKSATADTVRTILFTNVDRKSTLHTDESNLYRYVGKAFDQHHTVKHSHREYVRGDVHTNTIEGFFSIFKRGMKGIYQHCGEAHLQRYLAEFDFRYNARKISDVERSERALSQIGGKRLTYRRIGEASQH